MAGKKGRSGRRRGSTSWWRNPTALAGHHLNVLIEMWLAGVPIQVEPERWLMQPTERRYTVPPKIKRVLAAMAIRHVMDECEFDRGRAESPPCWHGRDGRRRRSPCAVRREQSRATRPRLHTRSMRRT